MKNVVQNKDVKLTFKYLETNFILSNNIQLLMYWEPLFVSGIFLSANLYRKHSICHFFNTYISGQKGSFHLSPLHT